MSFKDIKGQDGVVRLLQEDISRGRLAHGYLLVGPDGAGKRMVAKNLAKVLNCNSPIGDERGSLDCCDGCPSCRKIDSFNHPDVSWIGPDGPSGSIKIGEVRQIRRAISLRPYEGRKKVYIIAKADSMTEEASNCLLKTLEEPPADSLLILTSANTDRLLPTIVSRCRVIRFAEKSSGLDGAGEVIERFLLENGRIRDEEFDGLCNESRERIGEILEIFISWYRDILIMKTKCPPSMLINMERYKDILNLAEDYSFQSLEEIIELVSKTRYLIQQNVNPKIALGMMGMKLKEIAEKV